MKTLIELLQIIRLALALYKKAGYELSRQQLLKIMEEKDDKKTADYLRDILNK